MDHTALLKVSDLKAIEGKVDVLNEQIAEHADDSSVRILRVENIPGVGNTEFLLELGFILTTGISASLLANLIYDSIMKKGEREIIVKKSRKILITKKDVEIFIEEITEEQK